MLTKHTLKVNSSFTPILQEIQKMGLEQKKAMNDKVQDLLKEGLIREI